MLIFMASCCQSELLPLYRALLQPVAKCGKSAGVQALLQSVQHSLTRFQLAQYNAARKPKVDSEWQWELLDQQQRDARIRASAGATVSVHMPLTQLTQ